MIFTTEVTQAFADKFRNADGLVDLTIDQRNALVASMENWEVTDFRKFRDYLIGQDVGLVGYFKANLDTAPGAWKVLNDGDSALLTASDVATRQRAIERMAEDLLTHPGFDNFVKEAGNMAKWEKINSAVTGVSKKLAEWFEDLWFTDRVIVDAPVGNSVTLKVEAGGSPDAIGKIDNGDVNISGPAYDDVGAGPFLADDVLEVSEDGSHAIVKNASTGKAACRSGQCFPAGTPVLTTSGISLPIESIREGQLVAAWDDHRQDTVHAKVVRTFTKVANGLRRIITAGQDTILATREHPFYVPSLRQYLPADSIKTGMQLLTFTGALLSVIHHENLDTTVQVYNFEVAQYHNYFVGEEGMLVHNSCRLRAAGVTEADLATAFPNHAGEVVRMRDKLHELLGHQKLDGPLYDFFRNGNLPPDPAITQRRLQCMAALKYGGQQQIVASLKKVEVFLENPGFPATPGNVPYWKQIQDNIKVAPANRIENIINGLGIGIIRKYAAPFGSEITTIDYLRSTHSIPPLSAPPGTRKNIGITKGDIGPTSIDLKCRSGETDVTYNNVTCTWKRDFPIAPEHYLGPNGWRRHSEQKIADKIWELSLTQPISGSVRIVSEAEYCGNCLSIIDELQLDFPNLEIIRVDLNRLMGP